MIYKKRKLFNLGINNADYNICEVAYIEGKRKIVWRCPFYDCWYEMMKRCYSKSFLSKNRSYEGCSVIEDWYTFLNFKNWMETQDWESRELDKDLLQKGNKVYSKDTCLFIPKKLNGFISGDNKKELVGASWKSANCKYTSQCNNPFTNLNEYLGLFETELEAHLAWKTRKHEHACKLAELETDPRIIQALRTRYL